MNKKQLLSFIKDISINIWAGLERLASNAWFAYLAIIILQLKRIWGAWDHKDLTFGDTSSYYMNAFGWVHEFSVKIHWSPLYTAYYGTILKLIQDVYWGTLIHRLLIVLALAILVLAVMRFLLPAHIAWLISAWWVILPINFNSLYEVHLFAVVLPLTAVMLVLYKPGIWSRGIALGILLVSMLLVRNEIIIALSLWSLICLIWEIRKIKLQDGREFKIYLLAYGIPVLIASLTFGFFYWRTLIKPSEESIESKHTVNVCQIYSFGYQQRHLDWNKSPWTECQELMTRDFGQNLPTMVEAIQSNPSAMLEHFLWNIRLFPAGLQAALFNATSGNLNPDYILIRMNTPIALILSLIALLLGIVGLSQFLRERKYWWSFWINERFWGWTIFFCLAAVMLLVVPMQRPRPSYMFLMTLFIMAVLGMCLFVVIQRSSIYRHFPKLVSMIMIASPFFVPSFFSAGESPLLNLYKRLSPMHEFIGIPGTAIVINDYPQELCNYFTKSSRGACVGYTYQVFNELNENISISEVLEKQPYRFTLLYLNEYFFTTYGNISSVQAFLANPEQEGWKLVAVQEDGSDERWQVYINLDLISSIP